MITNMNVSYHCCFSSIHYNQVILPAAACWQFDTIQQLQQPNERRSAKCFEDFEGDKLKEAQEQTMILLTKSSILQDTIAGTADGKEKKIIRKGCMDVYF